VNDARDTTAAAAATEDLDARVDDVLARLTLDEKLRMLAGDLPLHDVVRMGRHYNERPYVAAAVPRLGLDGIRFTDGPRGVVIGRSTEFPVSMARGATFTPELEERIGDAIGVEARAQGANLFAGVCVNLLRHPAWGRAQETYGEDSHLLGEMGAALVRGVQRHVMACVKHFACNSIENSRFKVDVQINDADLRDLYLPHFKRCVDAGAASVMSAYNKVNDTWCGHHRSLLTDVLKGAWGFDGFVMSDFILGIRSAADALGGGQDLEMPARLRFRRLPALVRRGVVSMARVDDAVRRLVRTQLRFAGRGTPARYRVAAVACAAHQALALEAAEKSIVLLKNDAAAGDCAPLLPVDVERVHRIAVIGRLATRRNTGDRGSSRVRAPAVVTILDGVRAAAAGRGIGLVESATDDLGLAASAARAADLALVVCGCTFRDEGEYLGVLGGGGDRRTLRLSAAHERLIETVAAANPRTAVVLMGGSAFVTESWRAQVAGMLMAWYPGMRGGDAVARIVFGDVNPSGKLPCTWPRSEAQLPPFDRHARRVRYGPLHGYRLMQAERRDPAFWFGFGLSYTTFALGTPAVDGDAVVVEVRNVGSQPGDEVVQFYADLALGSDPRPLHTLRGFRRVSLAPGQSHVVRFTLAPAWRVVHVGTSANPRTLRTVEIGP